MIHEKKKMLPGALPFKKVCTFDIRRRYFRSEKLKYIWFFAHLIVSLTFVKDTFARQFKKNEFLFGIVLA